MSQNSMATPQTKKRLALLSSNSVLQSELLAKLISIELNVSCEVFDSPEQMPPDVALILVDCNGQEFEHLSTTVNNLHLNVEEVPAALLNAEYASDHEKLLEWPSIFGIFYLDTDQEQLMRGLSCLLEGDYWVPRKLLHHFLDKNRKVPTNGLQKLDTNLTKREKQILKLIKEGATNAAISEALEVSEHTVKSHLYNVYKKIGVKNRLEASNWVRDIEGL